MASVWLDEAGWKTGDVPNLCLQCGAPAPDRVPTTFVYRPAWAYTTIFLTLAASNLVFRFPPSGWAYLALGLCLLVVAIVTFVARESFRSRVPMCPSHKDHWRKRMLWSSVSFLALVLLGPLGMTLLLLSSDLETPPLLPVLVGVVLLGDVLLCLVGWSTMARLTYRGTIRPSNVSKGLLELRNVSPLFVDAYEGMARGGTDRPIRKAPPRTTRRERAKTTARTEGLSLPSAPPTIRPMQWTFATHLARYGPDSSLPPPTPAQARQYVRLVAHAHYENFSVASALLPARLRRHFHAVYAYCRWADDLADESGGGAEALRLLGWWRGQLLACYAGEATHPVFLALRETIETFAIPPEPFLDLIVAFEQDQRVGTYATFDDLLGYCANSADPVGRLVLYLFRCHDEERGGLSDSICTALQLANFWQDVSRDLDIGRVYLPAEDRLRFGVGDEDLLARRFAPAFAELLEFEVARTRDLMFRGYRLVELVPGEFRPTLELFVEGGLAILARIERVGYDTLSRRPSLSKWDKGLLVARAGWRLLRSRMGVA